MNFDKYSAYCKEHLDEFRDELRDDASRALRNWPGKTAALLLIASSIFTWLSLRAADNPMANKALLAYVLPILLIFSYPWASLIFSRLDKHARTILDIFLLGILIGFCQSLSYVFAPDMNTVLRLSVTVKEAW